MTALDVFNVLPMQDRGNVASPFYPHPYGGIGRDISVTREGFKRFFDIDEGHMCLAESFGLGKVIDEMTDDWTECVGYVNSNPQLTKYEITVIHKHGTRVSELLQIAPYLWEGNDDCDPHGIERPQDPIIWGDYKGPPEDY